MKQASVMTGADAYVGSVTSLGERMLKTGIDLAESGWVPDAVTRAGIRAILRQRLADEQRLRRETVGDPTLDLMAYLRAQPIAVHTDKVNEQHYELPAEFFRQVLGRRLKYSSCYWPAGVSTLDAAEEAMLALSCERAEIADGMRILDLGCGWGSLSLWLAERYPSASILAVSNAGNQRGFVESECRRRRLANVEVVTADANELEPSGRFDRVVSVEMFEHMRNPEALLQRLSNWLSPGGKAFVHVFSHREYAYLYETEGAANWMGRFFFTGGMMPSHSLFDLFECDLVLEKSWRLAGTHYARTLEAWLQKMDRKRAAVLPILTATYGAGETERWFGRWRMFFMACAELFGYREGREWGVSHYLLRRE
jgi:cyclopropane-fatty-acyl-phospholipid synthase